METEGLNYNVCRHWNQRVLDHNVGSSTFADSRMASCSAHVLNRALHTADAWAENSTNRHRRVSYSRVCPLLLVSRPSHLLLRLKQALSTVSLPLERHWCRMAALGRPQLQPNR